MGFIGHNMSWFQFICVIVVALIIGGLFMYGFNYLVFKTMDKIDQEARKTVETLMKDQDEK